MRLLNIKRAVSGALLVALTGAALLWMREPVVLTYHSVGDEPSTENTELFVTLDDFTEQVKWLRDNGYSFLFADEYQVHLKKSVILTFDDGYEDNYLNALPILKEYGARATVFLVTDSIGKTGYLTREEIDEMAKSGLVRFGSHTAGHVNARGLTKEDLADQFSRSKTAIYELTGHEADTLAWPFGEYDDGAISLAREYFHIAFTTERTFTWGRYRIPRVTVPRDMTMAEFTRRVREG